MRRKTKSCCSPSCRPPAARRALPALLAALLALSGCGGGKEDSLRIGAALYTQDDTFISAMAQDLEGLVREAESGSGEKITLFIADGKSSQSTQMDQVDRFLARGCDVLFVNLVDRTAAAVIADKAEAEGVPLVFFNRQPVAEDIDYRERVYYVGARAEESGALQGQLVLGAWRDEGLGLDRSEDGVLQYVMLEGEPGHQDSLLRTEWSVKTLTDAGVAVEKLDGDAANWNRGQAAAKMAQWLEEFGDGIEVVFSNNDDMALGAIDACLDAGMEPEEMPFIVGVDATAPALRAVEEGTLRGTVLNDAAGQAEDILALSCALARGEDPAVELEDGKYCWRQHTAVTRENLAEFLPEAS